MAAMTHEHDGLHGFFHREHGAIVLIVFVVTEPPARALYARGPQQAPQ
jgi:hypothetical protein